MRRATLWSLMLAAALAACGGDAGSDKPTGDGDTGEETDDVSMGGPTGDGDTGGDGAGEALCALAEGGGLNGYMGVKTWTRADFEACLEACPMLDMACITASCAPGFATFNACFGRQINACLTAPEGPCRKEFEAHLCCADEKCDIETSSAMQCVEMQCDPTLKGFEACGDGGGIKACAAPAALACFAEPPQGGAASVTTTDFVDTLPGELDVRLMIDRPWRSVPAALRAAAESSDD